MSSIGSPAQDTCLAAVCISSGPIFMVSCADIGPRLQCRSYARQEFFDRKRLRYVVVAPVRRRPYRNIILAVRIIIDVALAPTRRPRSRSCRASGRAKLGRNCPTARRQAGYPVKRSLNGISSCVSSSSMKREILGSSFNYQYTDMRISSDCERQDVPPAHPCVKSVYHEGNREKGQTFILLLDDDVVLCGRVYCCGLTRFAGCCGLD